LIIKAFENRNKSLYFKKDSRKDRQENRRKRKENNIGATILCVPLVTFATFA